MTQDSFRDEERRREERIWREEGRRRFNEELDRFLQRYAKLGAFLALVALLLAEFPEIWLAPFLGRHDDSLLQVLASRSEVGFAFTNRSGEALGSCEATITDSMGTEWRADVSAQVAANQTIELPWSDFRHEEEAMTADSARTRSIVVSCYVEQLHGRRAARFDAPQSRPHPVTPGR